jgi:hypothetical protein
LIIILRAFNLKMTNIEAKGVLYDKNEPMRTPTNPVAQNAGISD